MPSQGIDHQQVRALRERPLYRLLTRTARAQTNQILAAIRARGHNDLQASHVGVLINVDTEGTRITDLAAKTGITRQAVSQVVAQLEQLGYVDRRADGTDGRAVVVHFTDKGWVLLHDAREIAETLEADYAAAVGTDDLEALKTTLQQLLAHIDPDGGFEPPH